MMAPMRRAEVLSEQLRVSRVVVTLPDADPEALMLPCEVMVQEDLTCFAVQAGSYGVLREIADMFAGRAEFGLAGLRSAAQLHQVDASRVAFALLAAADAELMQECAQAGITAFPPAMTPTEIAAAHRAGAPAVQVVPVDALAGDYAAHVGAVLPGVPVIAAAAGRMQLGTFADWLDAGALAVVLDESFVGNAIYVGGDLEGLRERCHDYTMRTPVPREWTRPHGKD